MMTLKDLFETFWTITEVRITAREPETGIFIHEWIYGPAIGVSTYMRYDIADGKLTVVDGKINAHGDQTRGGSEIGWGVKEKLFPKKLIEAPITHMSATNKWHGGHSIAVDVEMSKLEALALVPEENSEDEEIQR